MKTGKLSDGLIDGTVTFYYDYEKNKIAAKIPYKKGKKEGLGKIFDTNGKVVDEIPCKNDQINGTRKEYSSTGKLIKKSVYKNGELNGKAIVYDEKSGKPMFEVLFKEGQPSEGWRYENGKKIKLEKSK